MSWISGIFARFAQAANRSAAEQRMDDEFLFHLEMEAEHLESTGLSPEEARRRARLNFGGRDGHRETVREQRKMPFVEDFIRDLGYGLRGLRGSPGYSLAAILTLALGIAATTVTFGVIDALFLRSPAGVVDADRLARLLIVRDEGGTQGPAGMPSDYRDFEAIRAGSDAFVDVAAYSWPQALDFGIGEGASQVQVSTVSGNFFSLLGVIPAVGRVFTEDDGDGSPPRAVLSYSLWTGRLGGDPAIIGSQVLIKGDPVTVIGVSRKGFIGTGLESVDVWLTRSAAADSGGSIFRGDGVYSMIGRLRPGVTRERAAAEARRHVYTGSEEDFLDPTPGLEVIPLAAARYPGASAYGRTTLWTAGASVFLLLIACSSVGNMLLARGAARGRELAVRSALGGTRGRLLRQLLTESLVLALVGGGVAILLTAAVGGVIRRFDLPPGADEMHFRVLGFGLLVCLVTALLTGLLPAVKVLSGDVAARLGTRLETGSARRSMLRKALVAFQVGTACMLLVGAAIFLRSFQRVMAVDPGFDPERVFVVTLDFGQISYGAADIPAFQNDAMERLARIPGIEATSRAFFVPLHASSMRMAWDDLAGNPIPYEEGPQQNYVTPDYFRTVGTPLVSAEPELFSGSSAGTGTVVVSASMAKLMAPNGEEVIGQCLRRQRIGGCLRVVGVAEDIRYQYLDDAITPMLYILDDENVDVSAMGPHSLLVRTTESAPATPTQIRSALQGVRPGLPYIRIDPLVERVFRDTSTYRLGAMLFSSLGAIALLLALTGTYGVLSYFVTERAPEFGIRRSIGAPAGAILRVTMREGFGPVVGGLAVGLAIAAFAVRYLQPLLFQTAAMDPMPFAAAAVVLCVGGLAAVLIPTLRVLAIDPAQALRAD